MEVLNEFLRTKGIYSLVMILFFLGIYGMVLAKNYMKKLMAMNVMQVAVIYFYLCFAQKDGGMVPVLDGITNNPNAYINPLPHGLMLTAIVYNRSKHQAVRQRVNVGIGIISNAVKYGNHTTVFLRKTQIEVNNSNLHNVHSH